VHKPCSNWESKFGFRIFLEIFFKAECHIPFLLEKNFKKNPESEFTFPIGTRFDAPDGFELVKQWGKLKKHFY